MLQLHGCVWAATETTWIAPDAWAACADRERALEAGETGRARLRRLLPPRRDRARRLHARRLRLAGRGLGAARAARRPTGGCRGEEVDDAIAEAIERFDVRRARLRPARLARRDRGLARAPTATSSSTSRPRAPADGAACDRFRVGVLEGDLTHDGDPVLARHVGHCVAKVTPVRDVVGEGRTRTRRARSTAPSPRSSPTTARCWHRANRPMSRWCRSGRGRDAPLLRACPICDEGATLGDRSQPATQRYAQPGRPPLMY